MDRIQTDLLVIGGGMAGCTASASAAGSGAAVILLERSPQLGGSAAISGGAVWTAPSFEAFRTENPLGDERLGRLVVEGYPAAIEWIRSLDVAVGPSLRVGEIGRGHTIDMLGFIRRAAAIVSASGSVVTEAVVRSLVTDGSGRVLGARVHQSDGDVEVRAAHTILATGGFQGDPALRAKHIHRNARGMLLRSNPTSRGDGLRLGLSVGAATSPFMDGFYGHLICSPITRFSTAEFKTLSLYRSGHGVLVNVDGERFTDESAGDHLNVQAVVRQRSRRAVLVVDERIHREHIDRQTVEGTPEIDRFAAAIAAGARYARAESLPRLAASLRTWGIDSAALLRTLGRYNSGVLLADEPPRRRWHVPLAESPFHALELQPAITFTNGGLRVDAAAHVLDSREAAVPGLLAAGADAGGVYQKGYAGSLAVALVQGRCAAETALADPRADRPES